MFKSSYASKFRKFEPLSLADLKAVTDFIAVIVKLVEGTELRKFYAGIHQTLCWKLRYSQIKSFIILAVLR